MKPAGARIEQCEMLDERQEARFIASETGRLVGGTRFESLDRVQRDEELPELSFKDIAVLYRLHAQAGPVKKALEQAGIPVQVARGRSLFEEPGIEAVIAVLELLKDPGNDRAAAAVLENAVKGLGPKTVAALAARAAEHGTTVIDCIRNSGSLAEISADRWALLDSFLELLDGLAEKTAALALDQLIKEIAEKLFRAAAADRRTGWGSDR